MASAFLGSRGAVEAPQSICGTIRQCDLWEVEGGAVGSPWCLYQRCPLGSRSTSSVPPLGTGWRRFCRGAIRRVNRIGGGVAVLRRLLSVTLRGHCMFNCSNCTAWDGWGRFVVDGCESRSDGSTDLPLSIYGCCVFRTGKLCNTADILWLVLEKGMVNYQRPL